MTSFRPRQKYMNLAICSAREGIKRFEGGPFGACIVRKGKAIAVTHNTVLKENDPTCHAEIRAIRMASGRLERFDLSDCVIYSTTEPCPMCFAAIHWARIPEIIFGTAIPDVHKRGFHELSIPNKVMKRFGKSQIRIIPGFMEKECLELLRLWDRKEKKTIY